MRTDHDRSPSPTDASSTTAPQQVPSTPRELLVGGRWRAADSRARMAVVNPATEQTLAEVADAGPEDARAAAEGLAQAQPHWARTSARERSEILYRAFSLMVERTDELALLMTLEMGKPLAEARGEVAYAAEFFRWFAEEAVRIDGSFGDRPDGTARSLVMKQPVGPSLLITPWNFPLAMGSRKLGPALAAGCTALLKPAPQTPLSSLALAQILIEAGLPPQTLAVLPTSRAEAVVPELMSSGVFRKLSFTGSTEVGKLLLAQASANVMRTSMELGGNAPFIVLDDADLDVAVEAAFQAKMRNMGEACTAANRIFVHRSVAEPFAAGLANRLGGLTVGDGTQPGVDVGPLIDAASRDK
ncbi:aldehyde dehydrogenase family protein, partial [uncultured Aeromicrobium sp.]|uniref:aldehyde dehydrogenase family protein n=1 Tax=uncultured Aeromicrobium sp. TaxID=337820 RepID=UPI0025D07570